jgi:outer membrane protein assembly factor BamA
VGSLQMTQGVADFRQYFWWNPFTLAVRGMHFGRYGRDAEDPRLGPLFLGYPTMVRGYDYSRLRTLCTNELRVGVAAGPDCGIFSQTFGSRIGVVNAELRFPLIQALVAGPGIGFPPIEGIAFFDAGVAWDQNSSPVLERGLQPNPADRGLLTSMGVGGRINLFGYFILEAVYVNALARSATLGGRSDWHWQFAIQPGF